MSFKDDDDVATELNFDREKSPSSRAQDRSTSRVKDHGNKVIKKEKKVGMK